MKSKIFLLAIPVFLLTGLFLFISSCSKEDPEPLVPEPVATSIALISGGSQASDVESTLATPIEVIVKDQDGKAFPGQKVNFSVSEGAVSSATTRTDAVGKASVSWTLGATVGEQTLTITAFKANGTAALTGSPLNVTANANANLEATSIELVSGGDQSGDVENALSDPVKILVKDQDGNAFSGATVNFSVTEGTVSSDSETTDADGNASITWTLGPTEGTQTLTITSFKADGTTALTGSPISVQATANVVLVASSIELVSGGDQSGYGGDELHYPVIVIIKDQEGNAFTGATVNFAVAEGAVSSASEITDVGGHASAKWTLGTTEGDQSLTITTFKADGTTPLAGSPLLVNATVNSATSIEYIAGGDQTGETEQKLDDPIVILVKDQNGDPFKGVNVNFSVAEGSLSSASEITDTNGQASVLWTLGSTVGTQILNVTGFKSDGTTHLSGSPFTVSATAINTGEKVTDYDGNAYKTVQIGDQIWMAENLKVTHYADGTEIPFIADDAVWASLGDNSSDDAYCYYENDANGDYGALYSWAAAMKGAGSSSANPSGVQGACPTGWHLPSKAEFEELFTYLGGTSSGGKLKETGTLHWRSPNTGATNESGFTALPAGFRSYTDGLSMSAGAYTYWWSATQINYNKATGAGELYFEHANVYIGYYRMATGISVRCVKNE